VAAVIQENKRNAAGNSEKAVHPCPTSLPRSARSLHIQLPSFTIEMKNAVII